MQNYAKIVTFLTETAIIRAIPCYFPEHFPKNFFKKINDKGCIIQGK